MGLPQTLGELKERTRLLALSFPKSVTTKLCKNLFTKARTWKQPRCPSTDEWIRLWHIYTMRYFSVIKRNKIGSVVVMWMKLESVIQSKVSQKEKNKYRILTYVCEIMYDEI